MVQPAAIRRGGRTIRAEVAVRAGVVMRGVADHGRTPALQTGSGVADHGRTPALQTGGGVADHGRTPALQTGAPPHHPRAHLRAPEPGQPQRERAWGWDRGRRAR